MSTKKQLEGKIDAAIVDLTLLWQAIQAGDPKPELLVRVDDLQRRLATPD